MHAPLTGAGLAWPVFLVAHASLLARPYVAQAALRAHTMPASGRQPTNSPNSAGCSGHSASHTGSTWPGHMHTQPITCA